jgi:hypothetical protein
MPCCEMVEPRPLNGINISLVKVISKCRGMPLLSPVLITSTPMSYEGIIPRLLSME